jgi:hypothetical protein
MAKSHRGGDSRCARLQAIPRRSMAGATRPEREVIFRLEVEAATSSLLNPVPIPAARHLLAGRKGWLEVGHAGILSWSVPQEAI